MDRLRALLGRIDRKGYKSYKDLKGRYDFGDFTLSIDHVQGDPFAAPTRISIEVPAARACLPKTLWKNHPRQVALEDFLGRAVAAGVKRYVKGHRGTGKSGMIGIEAGGQQVLNRNAVLLTSQGVEARMVMGLPAAGRTVLGREAEEMFFKELPRAIAHGLFFENLSEQAAAAHVTSVEDQEYLRQWLSDNDLVAFVADGAILPRRSGVDDRPMGDEALPFRTPESLACEVDLPNAGMVRGMGIPRGVTLIVGGGFHGKSTLLHALERGIYDHIPGDGRERVATDPTAVKIRAEDGRSIANVNISPFIDRLPFGRDTTCFCTDNASGSTSQAANIMEALEGDTRLLLIDEDTSATNFMIRDERMQRLVSQEKEPITPFLHRVRELYDRHHVSTVIVMGGSGDYFDVADTVIMLDAYEPFDVTAQARALAKGTEEWPQPEGLPPMEPNRQRRPGRDVVNAARGNRDAKIDAKRLDTLLYGTHEIDLSKVEQLVDMGQVRAIGWLIHYYATHCVDSSGLMEGLAEIYARIEREGLDIIAPYKVGNLALPRLHEVAAAINRIRGGAWE